MASSIFTHDRVLIVGSGLSGDRLKRLRRPLAITTIAVNHGWMHNLSLVDWWLHSDDFIGTRPELQEHQREVKRYGKEINAWGGHDKLGYSIALNAVYWAAFHGAQEIGLIGCDMNYKPVDGKTHVYGIGLDIKKTGEPDPDKMVRLHGKDDPDYLSKIYMQAVEVTRRKIVNLSTDPDSRLPYERVDLQDFVSGTAI